MANDDDKQKQVHDDKNISGTPLHVLPHNVFKHPSRVGLVIPMGNGMIERYATKNPDRAVHIQGESDVTPRSGEPVVVEFQSDLIFTAKLHPRSRTAGKDEVEWKIEYDEEALLGSDDML
nr:hypothetical protein FVER53263_07623 [Fusarium verticillioides]